MKTKQVIMATMVTAAGMVQAAFVTIGNPGNTADTSGYGKVDYTYQISATEVTIAEFTASGAGSGNENYWNDGTRTVGTAAPAVNVSLYEAKKYANYLTQNANGGSTAFNLYSADGTGAGSYTRANALSDGRIVYALPTEDEWYKAAYYTGNGGDLWSLYANGTDTIPTHGTTDGWNYYNNGYANSGNTWTVGYGGEEQNGTYDMMGNVWEWMETSSGVLRGGRYSSSEYYLGSSYHDGPGPSVETYDVGFRVVAIPEPATALSLVLGGLLITGYRRLFGRV